MKSKSKKLWGKWNEPQVILSNTKHVNTDHMLKLGFIFYKLSLEKQTIEFEQVIHPIKLTEEMNWEKSSGA